MEVLPGKKFWIGRKKVERVKFIIFKEEDIDEDFLVNKVRDWDDAQIGDYVITLDGYVIEVLYRYPYLTDEVIVTPVGSYLLNVSDRYAYPIMNHPKTIRGIKRMIGSDKHIGKYYEPILSKWLKNKDLSLYDAAKSILREETGGRVSSFYIIALLDKMVRNFYMGEYIMNELKQKFNAQMEKVSEELNEGIVNKLIETGIDSDFIALQLKDIISNTSSDRTRLDAIKELNKLFGNYPNKVKRRANSDGFYLPSHEVEEIKQLSENNKKILVKDEEKDDEFHDLPVEGQ